jgi:hypothetical protein
MIRQSSGIAPQPVRVEEGLLVGRLEIVDARAVRVMAPRAALSS